MQPFESDIQACMQLIPQHGVWLYPTDTVWGLGCCAHDEEAVARIFEIKRRPANQSFIVLMTDYKQLLRYIANPLPHLPDILSSFDVPTTLVYQNAINLPTSVLAKDGSIGIRITNDPFCRSLIKRMKAPLISTSANISGQPNNGRYHDIPDEIKQGVDYVVTWRQDDTALSTPSQIFKLDDEGGLIRLR